MKADVKSLGSLLMWAKLPIMLGGILTTQEGTEVADMRFCYLEELILELQCYRTLQLGNSRKTLLYKTQEQKKKVHFVW